MSTADGCRDRGVVGTGEPLQTGMRPSRPSSHTLDRNATPLACLTYIGSRKPFRW
jgi:hypothetical protein